MVSKGFELEVGLSSGRGWDEYVLRNPRSSFYHLYGWKEALENTFGFRSFYLEAVENGKVCGILPLVLSGSKLVSIPIGIYAGVLGDNDAVETVLLAEAIKLTKHYHCDYLELRNINEIKDGFSNKELYVTFMKRLPEASRDCLGSLPRKARAAARCAIDCGLVCDVSLKYLDAGYEIYALNQKQLGSPVVSKEWFEWLVKIFPEYTNILAVKYKDKVIASVLTFFYKDTVLPFYGASLSRFEEYHPNNFMYLKLQEYAVEKGYKCFDFGRSRRDSGSYSFKINQGFEPTKLYYQYYLNRVKKVPQISPSNKSFRFSKSVWRVLPFSVTKWLGPKLFRYVMP